MKDTALRICLKHLIPALTAIYSELGEVPEDSSLLTVKEAAELLKVDESWIYNRRDLFKSVRVGKHIRIPMSEIKRLKAS